MQNFLFIINRTTVVGIKRNVKFFKRNLKKWTETETRTCEYYFFFNNSLLVRKKNTRAEIETKPKASESSTITIKLA